VQVEETVQVAASASQLWQAVADVEHWSEWTPTFNEVTWLTGAAAGPDAAAGDAAAGPLRPGGRARVRQPRLPEQIWEVTEVAPGTSFTWHASGPGITTTGTHQVRPLGPDTAELTIGISVTGMLAPVVGPLVRGKTRRNLQQEADGLKRCAEVLASTPG
jgi:hypothetical protein